MASQREIKRRIRSIKNTAQITKAMQMVAASRMRKAQQQVTDTRAYAQHIRGIVADISRRSGADEHPLLTKRDGNRVEIVVLTPDRGLAGSLVVNLNRETIRLAERVGGDVRVVAVGRKGRDFTLRMRWKLVAEFTNIGDHPDASVIGPVAQQILEDFENDAVDAVYLVYSEFVSTLRQTPRAVQLLPVIAPDQKDEEEVRLGGPWNYEPDDPQAVLSALLPRYIEFTMYQALLETKASEHSSRMVAMSNATDNANELASDLTLLANKARQAEITKEIAEISGAAEALRTG
ncbi:MAG TPA: ATP synthase F1 subunit gamma [Chloroflexota bacterium]|jgi:F-type H+-transporting ATPase subunit gamma